MNSKQAMEKALKRIRTIGWRNDALVLNLDGSCPAFLEVCDGPLCVLNTLALYQCYTLTLNANGYLRTALEGVSSIGAWNDEPGRTQEDVENALLRAIALAEAAHED